MTMSKKEVSCTMASNLTESTNLAVSNFKVAQDMRVTNNAMHSIFKQDYPAYDHYGRGPEAERPMLAEVMHRDTNHFPNKESETVSSFEYRYLPKPVVLNVHEKLRSTNFKMDADLNKVNSFETVHDSYFTPKMNWNYERTQPTTNISESHIPQGDPDKAPDPWSDYRDRFRGHDTTKFRIVKAPSMHEGGPPTIKGDARTTNFDTTNKDTFQGEWQNPVQTLPAPTGTSVPNGDPSKEYTQKTTMQESFPDLSSQNDYKPYNQAFVSSKLGKTNFKQQDGHGKYNDYMSTATVSYLPSAIPVERFRPGKHRNHSDLPEGDMDRSRGTERVNMTTSRFYHGSPARGLHNTIISGANLRTKSNVLFGEPQLTSNYYDTTTEDTFKPVTVPYTYNRAKFYKSSDVPLDYYNKSEPKFSTQWNIYYPFLFQLKKSHILPALSGPQNLATTHQLMFTPKQVDRYVYDSGRLQKSSVPLGTMSITKT
ncbi:hypothetical protein KUTeg_017660 [Tegillarca granosa]|uniref:Uncharacterized protein n=1 Tax=Tegillarca granosa TaxID=220873 RepID=A0ABQ9EKG6_TEGGR|nr:hypothetical protein KUTeg_017660 [Tegillarca granosa]